MVECVSGVDLHHSISIHQHRLTQLGKQNLKICGTGSALMRNSSPVGHSQAITLTFMFGLRRLMVVVVVVVDSM